MKLLGTASTMALIAFSGAAMAQEQPADDGATGLAEIVVTAQKRVEDGQKAPLALTSVDSEILAAAHISGATELQRIVPNLTAQTGGGAGDPGGSNTVFTIRGLGASATGPQGSAGVAAHFDGVYRQDGISNSEFYDLERIEVAPGPQGTLYGRSAAAGAINIIPAKPVNRAEYAASVSYGNYDALTAQVMVNVPLGDHIAARVAFQKQDRDGYYSNGYDDLDALSGRFQLLFTPDDRLSVRLAANFTQLRGTGAGSVFVDGPGFPGLVAVVPRAGNPDPRKASISDLCLINGLVATCRQDISIDKTSALAEINYDFGAAVLTLLPAFNKSARRSANANAPLPLSTYDQTPYTNEQINFEGRLSDGGDGKLKWIVGGNYYQNKVDTFVNQFINVIVPVIPLPTPPFPPGTAVRGVVATNAFQDQQSKQESYGVFGQATYPLTDTLRVTVGGRYNHDVSRGTQTLGNISNLIYVNSGFPPLVGQVLQNLAITPGNPTGGPVITPVQTGRASFDAFTWRVAIDADLGPQSLVYASVGTGYKPGSLNDGGPISSTVPASPFAPEQFFGPEKVTHYEIGTKNRFLGNTLQVNAVAFYDDYKNYHNGQTQVVNPLQFGALGFVVTNAGKARIYGAELAVKWQLSENDLFEISGNYLDAKFTDYISPAYLGPNGPAPALDISGYDLPNAPKFSGNVSYRHTFDLGGAGRVVASAFSRLSDGYFVYFAQAPGTYQKSYTNTTLDLSWFSTGNRFQISAFVKNLEDHDVKVFGGTTAGYTQVGFAPPRTYGGTFAFKF